MKYSIIVAAFLCSCTSSKNGSNSVKPVMVEQRLSNLQHNFGIICVYDSLTWKVSQVTDTNELNRIDSIISNYKQTH